MQLNWGAALKNLAATATGYEQGKLQAQQIQQQREQEQLQRQLQLQQLAQSQQRLSFDRDELALRRQSMEQEHALAPVKLLSPYLGSEAALKVLGAYASGRQKDVENASVPGLDIPGSVGMGATAGMVFPPIHREAMKGLPAYIYGMKTRQQEEDESLAKKLRLQSDLEKERDAAAAAAKASDTQKDRVFRLALAVINNNAQAANSAYGHKLSLMGQLYAQGDTWNVAEAKVNQQRPDLSGVNLSIGDVMRAFGISANQALGTEAPAAAPATPAAPAPSRTGRTGPQVPEAAQGVVGGAIGGVTPSAPAPAAPGASTVIPGDERSPVAQAKIDADTARKKKEDLAAKKAQIELEFDREHRSLLNDSLRAQIKNTIIQGQYRKLEFGLAQQQHNLEERKFKASRNDKAMERLDAKEKTLWDRRLAYANLRLNYAKVQDNGSHTEEAKAIQREMAANEKAQDGVRKAIAESNANTDKRFPDPAAVEAFRQKNNREPNAKELAAMPVTTALRQQLHGLQRERERLFGKVLEFDRKVPITAGDLSGLESMIPKSPSASVTAPGWDPAKKDARLRGIADFITVHQRKPTPAEARNIYQDVEDGRL